MTSRHPDLTIIIISFNVRKLLDQCLKSLFNDPHSKNWQIIVVDNASSDDTVEYLKKHYRVIPPLTKGRLGGVSLIISQNRNNDTTQQRHNKIQLIESDKNFGFSAGNNLATQYINAPYTLFLNPDTVVPQGTIPHMLQYIKQHKNVGAVTCKVLLPNKQLDDGCHRGFPTPWNSFCYFSGLSRLFPKTKLFSGYTLNYLNLNTIHEIDSLCGTFMLLRTEIGSQLHWFDQDYFWNGEDIDFCYRIKQLDYKIIYNPEVSITHYKGASAGYKKTSYGKNTASKNIRLLAAQSSTQAMKLFYQKHYHQQYPTWFSRMVFTGINLLEKQRINSINNKAIKYETIKP